MSAMLGKFTHGGPADARGSASNDNDAWFFRHVYEKCNSCSGVSSDLESSRQNVTSISEFWSRAAVLAYVQFKLCQLRIGLSTVYILEAPLPCTVVFVELIRLRGD